MYYSAVGEIHALLEHDDICNVWVSAHVKVDDGKKIISNRDDHKVSVLLLLLIFFFNILMFYYVMHY